MQGRHGAPMVIVHQRQSRPLLMHSRMIGKGRRQLRKGFACRLRVAPAADPRQPHDQRGTGQLVIGCSQGIAVMMLRRRRIELPFGVRTRKPVDQRPLLRPGKAAQAVQGSPCLEDGARRPVKTRGMALGIKCKACSNIGVGARRWHRCCRKNGISPQQGHDDRQLMIDAHDRSKAISCRQDFKPVGENARGWRGPWPC